MESVRPPFSEPHRIFCCCCRCGKQHLHLSSSTRAVWAVLFKTVWGPIKALSPLCLVSANSHHLPLWKGKPISCPHDVSIIIWLSLLVVTEQGPAPRGTLLNSPCLLAWFTAHNDGHRGLLHIWPHNSLHVRPLCTRLYCLKASDYISCPSVCPITPA